MTEFALNVAYFLAALCIAYKLAWIARQVAALPGRAQLALRGACILLGVIIMCRAAIRFFMPDPASAFDIVRELGWCIFLIAAIWTLRGPSGRY